MIAKPQYDDTTTQETFRHLHQMIQDAKEALVARHTEMVEARGKPSYDICNEFWGEALTHIMTLRKVERELSRLLLRPE